MYTVVDHDVPITKSKYEYYCFLNNQSMAHNKLETRKLPYKAGLHDYRLIIFTEQWLLIFHVKTERIRVYGLLLQVASIYV